MRHGTLKRTHSRCWPLQTLIMTAAIVWVAAGCDHSQSELVSTTKPRTLILESNGVHWNVVDGSGTARKQADGLAIVVSDAHFESQIFPRLAPDEQGRALNRIEVTGLYDIRNESLVVDVVQDPDGGASERSRDYAVVYFSEVDSASLK